MNYNYTRSANSSTAHDGIGIAASMAGGLDYLGSNALRRAYCCHLFINNL
jgi:hypothetical protein